MPGTNQPTPAKRSFDPRGRRSVAALASVGCLAVGLSFVGSASAVAPGDPTTGTAVAPVSAIAISAGGGAAVFSEYDATRKRYRLALTDGGTPRYLPAGERKVPFDASLGTDTDGKAVVTYTRCRKTAGPRFLQRGCVVRSLDITSGVATTVPTQRIAGGATWLPVMAHGTLVYGRLRDLGRNITRRKVSGKVVRERFHNYRFELVERLTNGTTRRLKGGPDNVAAVQYPAQIGDYGAGVTALAFDGKHVAYAWTGPDQHNCPIDNFDRGGSIPVAGIVYVERAGRRQALDRGCDMGSRGTVGDVSITPTGVRWLRVGGPKTLLGTQPFGGEPSLARIPLARGTRVLSTSADAAAQWYSTYDGSHTQLYRLSN